MRLAQDGRTQGRANSGCKPLGMNQIEASSEQQARDLGEPDERRVRLHRHVLDVQVGEILVEQGAQLLQVRGHGEVPLVGPELPINVPQEGADAADRPTNDQQDLLAIVLTGGFQCSLDR